MNKIRRYYWQCSSGNKYSLKLSCNYRRDEWGKIWVNYTFKQNNVVLFSSDDFHPSPLYDPIGKKSSMDLLGFFTYIGNPEDDFYYYSPIRQAFLKSNDREELESLVYDYENKE